MRSNSISCSQLRKNQNLPWLLLINESCERTCWEKGLNTWLLHHFPPKSLNSSLDFVSLLEKIFISHISAEKMQSHWVPAKVFLPRYFLLEGGWVKWTGNCVWYDVKGTPSQVFSLLTPVCWTDKLFPFFPFSARIWRRWPATAARFFGVRQIYFFPHLYNRTGFKQHWGLSNTH